MAGEFGGLGFRGGIAGLLGSIGRFFSGFGGITAKDILRAVAHVKDGVTALETEHTGFLWGLGKLIGGALATVGAFFRDHGGAALRFIGDKFKRLERWLKDKFGPVLSFLKKLKDHVDEIYRKWIKPIVDTIEFLRAINRVLQVFHIDVLQALDRKLQQLEQRIEAPFDWTRRIITEVQNALDRILTLDGLFLRVTLVRSLASYAPDWLRIAVNVRKKPLTEADYERAKAPLNRGIVQDVNGAVRDSLLNRGGAYQTFVDEHAIAWRQYIESA